MGNTPPVVKNLIIINVLMLLGSMLFQQLFHTNLSMRLGLFYFQSPLFKPWQIVTHMFMHGGLAHIFFNMWALWIFGKTLESVWGSQRFLIYYMVTGLGAAFFYSLVNYIQYAPDVAALKAAYSVDRINMKLLNEILTPGNPLGLPVQSTGFCWPLACYFPTHRYSSFPYQSRSKLNGWSWDLERWNYFLE
jgi:hypothetical protein